jgi:hypothetical protein
MGRALWSVTSRCDDDSNFVYASLTGHGSKFSNETSKSVNTKVVEQVWVNIFRKRRTVGKVDVFHGTNE